MPAHEATCIPAVEISDEEIIQLLLGGAEERNAGADALFKKFHNRLMGRLRGFISSDDEKESVVDDVFLAVVKMADKRTLDPKWCLPHLLLAICRKKMADRMREKRRQVPMDELTDEIASTLADTGAGLAWKVIEDNEEEIAVEYEFRSFIEMLPPKQRVVADMMRNNLPFRLTSREIAEKIFEKTGKCVGQNAAKKAIQVVREKFYWILKRHCPYLNLHFYEKKHKK